MKLKQWGGNSSPRRAVVRIVVERLMALPEEANLKEELREEKEHLAVLFEEDGWWEIDGEGEIREVKREDFGEVERNDKTLGDIH